MGLFSNLFGLERPTEIRETADRIELMERNANLTQELMIRESATGLAALRLEDYMWEPITGWNRDEGLSIDQIKKEADHCRQLYAINPLLKKAINARIGMIHGKGARIAVSDRNGAGQQALDLKLEKLSRKLLGETARARLEAELSSAGNVWAITEGDKPFIIVPINQIAGYVSDVNDPTTVKYWRRSYTTIQTDIRTGTESSVTINEYIPSVENVGKHPPKIGEVPVRRGARMHHIAANRQETWVLGLPDLFAAKFWAKGHKEMYEAGHEFTLAQGKIAAKVTANGGAGAQMAASRLADEPRRDWETGEPYGYGGTAIMNNGTDVQLMGKMGGSVDFKNYDRITGLIAAATGVPVSVLLAEADSEEKSLEQSVIDDMKLRQSLWTEFYVDILSPRKVHVVWPRIKQDSLYRTQQALEISNRTNTLHADEKRLIALESYGLEGDARALPNIEDHPDVLVYRAKKEIDLEYAPKIAEAAAAAVPEGDDDEDPNDRSTTPDQGKDENVGKLSDGKDAHDARDAGEQEHTR